MQPSAPSSLRSNRSVAALAVGALLAVGTAAVPAPAQAAVGTVANAHSSRAVPGSYLVLLENGAGPDVAERHGAHVLRSYHSALHGLLVRADERQARRLAADPSVRLVEQNTSLPPAATRRTTVQRPSPSCGLDRIDQPALPLDGSYSYPAGAGAGVDVYLIDSGIEYGHPDLAPRARPGFDAFGGDGSDELGNGTYMAGIIGGTRYGVAKKANLISVKVLDAEGGGSLDGVIAGIDWVTEHASGPSVVNFVIGLPATEALDAAVRRSIASGVTYSLEAGADAADLADSSPARVREGLTVGASDCADAAASFSNYGAGLDLYAPGVDIVSDTPGGGTRTDSGTTAAAAHVAGVAALYLSRHPRARPATVGKALKKAAVKGAVSGVPTPQTPNRLLQSAD